MWAAPFGATTPLVPTSSVCRQIKMRFNAVTRSTTMTSKMAALVMLSISIAILSSYCSSSSNLACNRNAKQGRVNPDVFFSSADVDGPTLPLCVKSDAAFHLRLALRSARSQFRRLPLDYSSKSNSDSFASRAKGNSPPLLSPSSSIFGSSGCVDASWLEKQGFTQSDFVHESHALKSVWCVQGSSLPCGTSHHAVSFNSVTTSYSKLCGDRKLRCTRRWMRVNSVWAFHVLARQGILIDSNKQWKVFMHDTRFPFVAQYALHAVQASIRSVLQQFKRKNINLSPQEDVTKLALPKTNLLLQETTINLTNASRVLERCSKNSDCDSPHVCRRTSLGTIKLCRSAAAAGYFCDGGFDCTGILLCRRNRCSAYSARCRTSSQCGSGYRCRFLSRTSSHKGCWRLALTGTYCRLSYHCAGRGLCRSNVCTLAPSPSPRSSYLATCRTKSDCSSRHRCRRLSRSNFLKRCRLLALLGSFCDFSGDCTGALLCRANKCTTFLSRCSTASNCASPYVCRGYSTANTLKKCRRKSSTGEYCEFSSHCLGADLCRGTVCKSTSPSPTPSRTPSPSPALSGKHLSECSRDSDCDSLLLVCRRISETDAGSRRCREKTSTGEYCERNSHCVGNDLCSKSNKCYSKISKPTPTTQSPAARTDNGTSCQRDTECASPTVCRYQSSAAEASRICRGKSVTGQYCDRQAHCLIADDTCTASVCTKAKKATGEASKLGVGPIVGIVTAAAAVITAIAGAIRAREAIKKRLQSRSRGNSLS